MWTNENRGRYDRSRLRYPSDLSDEEWCLIEPLIPPAKRFRYTQVWNSMILQQAPNKSATGGGHEYERSKPAAEAPVCGVPPRRQCGLLGSV